MTSEKAEYMRQLRADNPDYAERNRNRIRADGRALRRLKAKYPREYQLFFDEEVEKMRAKGMKV